MSAHTFQYAVPSVFESTRTRALLGLASDSARPVRFHARVARELLSFRLSLQALGELIWRTDDWTSLTSLDPVATVHPDRVFFEALSGDQSAYGLVIVDREVFEPNGEVSYGTTNVDFTAWLWAALAEMRSSRETFLRIGAEGLEVATAGFGGRFERKVEVPDAWVRGFLQLQGAMALPGTRISVRPVELISAIRFLRATKAKVSPRALRYELEPGREAALVLEPWEHVIPLRGAEHGFDERRTIRTWGRRRLSLLEPLLPFAERVDIYLKGRALPSFYAVKLPRVTFVLGLSGWTGQRWTGSASFDLLLSPGDSSALQDRVLAHLRSRHTADARTLAAELGSDPAAVSAALSALVAEGRAMFDVEARNYRHRELFANPIDRARLYPPDPRREAAARLVARGEVEISSAAPRETRKQKRLKTPEGSLFREVVLRDWVVEGRVGPEDRVELVLDDEDRMIFGRCGCPFFRENILAMGPCEHLVALLSVARPARRDAASSVALEPEALAAKGREAAPDLDPEEGSVEDD